MDRAYQELLRSLNQSKRSPTSSPAPAPTQTAPSKPGWLAKPVRKYLCSAGIEVPAHKAPRSPAPRAREAWSSTVLEFPALAARTRPVTVSRHNSEAEPE